MNTMPGSPSPRGADHPVEDLLGQEPARDFTAVRIDQVVLAARGQRVHEPVGRRDGDVEVGDAPVELAVDELEDVRMIDRRIPCSRRGAFHPASPLRSRC